MRAIPRPFYFFATGATVRPFQKEGLMSNTLKISLTFVLMMIGAPLVAAFPTNRLGRQYEIGQTLGLSWLTADAVAIAG